MDPSTLLLLLVVAAVASSQLLNHSGRWILKPWIYWPVQSLLIGLLVFVLAAPLEGFVQDVRLPLRGFLLLFVAWRLVQNWRWRARIRVQAAEEDRLKAAYKARGVGGVGDEDDLET